MTAFRPAKYSLGLVASASFRFTVLALCALTVFIGGCAKEGACRVSGKVTLDKEPLTEGLVMFLPDGDPQLKTVSALVKNGTYVVESTTGLWPGKYKVAFTAEEPSGKKIQADPGSKSEMIDQYVQVIPPKFNAATTLTAEIVGNQSDLNFELTRK